MRTWLYVLGVPLTLASGMLIAQTGSGYLITTVAGGYLGDNGPATAAALSNTEKAITDSVGNLYISDTGNHRIRQVSASGVITTFAGTGTAGYSGDDQPAKASQLNNPIGLALDAQNNLYVADFGNNRIRRITPAGVITTVAGGASATRLFGPRGIVFDASGNLYITDSGSGRLLRLTPKGELQAVLAGFSTPSGVALDPGGNVLVADIYHHIIVRVTPAGDSAVIAGSGSVGFSGDNDLATAARLYWPTDIAVDRTGVIYVADSGNNRIRKLTPAGSAYTISTVAGGGSLNVLTGDYTGDPLGAPLSGPRGVWVDSGGALLIADPGFGMIRKLDGGILRTIAGIGRSRGDGGPAVSAILSRPRDLAFDTTGNLLISDTGSQKIRKVSQNGVIQTLAGSGVAGGIGDGGNALSAQLNTPVGVASDSAGNVYIGDTANSRLRRVNPSGDIITIAGGNGPGGEGDGAGASSAQVRDINGIVVGVDGNIYLADTGNNRIRRILKDGTIERFAGTSYAGSGGDGIAAIQSSLNAPQRIAAAKDGSIYFSDTGNHRVRRVLPNGNVETVAGTGSAGFTGDGGAARSARLNSPVGVAVDGDGNVFIADTNNHCIRHVTPGGLIRTIAGTNKAGFSGDDGSAFTAQLSSPSGITVDSRGNIYFVDLGNNRIRRLSADVSAGRLTIVSGNNQSGSTGARLPAPLTVRLTNTAGVPVSGASVSFVVTRGLAQLSAASVVTNADGVASVTVTLGGVPGDVFVAVSAPGLLPIQFQLTIQGAVVTGQPRIFSGGVVGAGLSVPKIRHLASNGLYTIFGENFAQPGAGWQVGPGDLVNGQLPIRFQGVCVLVGDDLAPVIHVYPGQVSFQAPRMNATGVIVPVQVVLNCRENGEVRSNVENVEIRAASPEFLYFVQNADGRNPVAAVNAVTGVFAGVSGLVPGGNFVPAKPGDYVTVFGSGFGVTNPSFFAGELPDRIASLAAGVSITVGGKALATPDILYVGVTPGFAGLYQANIRIPDDAVDGNLPLSITIGGIPSPDGAYLTVKR